MTIPKIDMKTDVDGNPWPPRGEFEVQTRAVGGELKYFKTLKEAFEHAGNDKDVWKISFEIPSGERVRLVRNWLDEEHSVFEYSDLMDEVNEELRKRGQPDL